MSWLKEIKNDLHETSRQEKEQLALCRSEYKRVSPMVTALLKDLGKEWYGKLLFANRYKIETVPGVFFWGINRRGKGLGLLPQRLNIKMRLLENTTYFTVDVSFSNGPTFSMNTTDTTMESLKQTIIKLIYRD